MAEAKVIILAGGQGMRLREETEYRPKPMVEVGGKPLLWHIMKHYARHGFSDFVLCLGYKGEAIKSYFLNYHCLAVDFTLTLGKADSIVMHGQLSELDWQVTLAETGLSNQTGSRIKQVEKYVAGCEFFLLTYGDGLSDVDIGQLVRFHKSHGKIATVTGVAPPSRFGELVVSGSQVTEFSEKPQVSQGLINGGFFVLDRQVFAYLSDDPSLSFEREPLRRLAADGELMVYHHQGFWQCLDTMRDLLQLEECAKSGSAPWMTWKRQAPGV